jgi:hypothetical protein
MVEVAMRCDQGFSCAARDALATRIIANNRKINFDRLKNFISSQAKPKHNGECFRIMQPHPTKFYFASANQYDLWFAIGILYADL